MDTWGFSKTLSSYLRTVIVGVIIIFLWKLYNARIIFYRLRKRGMPMPSWNPIFGNMLTLPRLLKNFPTDAAKTYSFGILSREFKDDIYYLDIWPFSKPLICVFSPDLAYQVCQEYDLPKPVSLRPWFRPLTGGLGIFMMNGEEHKSSLAHFTPGFSASAILQHMGNIVDQAQVYAGILREHAKKGDMFELDDLTCWYMMDVIGTVCLNAQLNSLKDRSNVLVSSMRDQVEHLMGDEELNWFKKYSPVQLFREWYNGYKMDRYINAELDKRYQEWKASKSQDTSTKSVIDLAMVEYMRTHPEGDTLDTEFKKWACAQIRLFLYVGHDSTASTIVYCYYLLSKHPETLKRVREEHDAVFGDISATPQLLKDRPHLINQLPFTTAVIKESLRLFPPASSFRGGQPGVSLRGSDGTLYPTEGFAIWVLHDTIHRHPKFWPRPDEFLPERWLVEPEHPLYPPKWAWRPFEYGTRNCVGQTLVMLDVKVTLVMTLREFDIKDAYEEWDRVYSKEGEVKSVRGERAYQITAGSAHPANGFPCRVSTVVGNKV